MTENEGTLGEAIQSGMANALGEATVWIMVIPAVALAWGLLTARDKARTSIRKYRGRRRRARIARATA